MKKIFVVAMLILTVAVFAIADTLTEATLKVQFLQERSMRLQLEYALTLQGLEQAQIELQAIKDKEKEEKE